MDDDARPLTRRWLIAGAIGAAGVAALAWATAEGPLGRVLERGSGATGEETGGPTATAPKSTEGTTRPGPAPTATSDSVFGPSFRLEEHGGFGWDRTVVEPGAAPGGGTALRVTYPANSVSRRSAREHDTPDGGAQGYLSWVSGDSDEAWLAYDLRFPNGFEFVRGGKLPGMFGGSVTSGQHIPDGTNGFSTRYMWRAEGAGEVYAYLPTSETHGTSLGRENWVWPTGRWTHTVQHIRLNDPGSADGLIEVWIDGAAVLRQTGLTFRTVPELRIEGLFFSTFFGGDDPTWATPRDQAAEFANFTMSRSALPLR